MISAVFIVVALAVAASLGSWLFSQWIGAGQRSPILVIAVGGAGLVLLLGAAAFAIIVAPTWWKSFVPRIEAPLTNAPVTTVTALSPAVQMNALTEDWPATHCVKSLKSAAPAADWFIDNDCDRMVAVVFAWCPQALAPCDANSSGAPTWRYEPAGIVMASVTQRPSRQRLAGAGPLIAPTYALKAEGGARRRIRYLACYVTAADVLTLLNEPADPVSDAERSRQLEAALAADACYGRVARWSQAGQRQGKSPDALLREGIGGD